MTHNEETAIPDELRDVIISIPTEELSQHELDKLAEYVRIHENTKEVTYAEIRNDKI